MKIKISHCDDLDLRTQLRENTRFIMPILLKENQRLLDKVSITIKVNNKLTRKHKAWGLCYWTDNRHRPRKFVVIIDDSQSRSNFTRTLLHELVHVKQYVIGDLKDFCSGAAKWKKNVYEMDPADPDFLNSPWEREAYKMSHDLYVKYFKS
jgi:hypothetical protein